MSDDALLDLCMSRVRCFVRPGQTAHLPTKFLRTRWSSDPYALGAYSYWTKGSEPGMLFH